MKYLRPGPSLLAAVGCMMALSCSRAMPGPATPPVFALHAHDAPPHRTILPPRPAPAVPLADAPDVPGVPYRTQALVASPSLEARLLVIAARASDPELGSIRQTLDYLGTPYTVWIATERPGGLTAAELFSGSHSKFQGVILTNGDVSYPNAGRWVSALTAAEWTSLRSWEASFAVRQVAWVTYPSATDGYRAPTSERWVTGTPLNGRLTASGQTVFPYLTAGKTVPIVESYVTFAKPLNASCTPLLVDGGGNALAAVYKTSDGRESLSFTFDSDPYGLHTLSLAYGTVNWVTRGLFLGDRHVAMSVQVDDIFLPTPLYETTQSYHMSGQDLNALVAWQKAKQALPMTAAMKLELAFNGEAAFGYYYSPDTLTPAVQAQQGQFNWLNHTYRHPNLDAMAYAGAREEIQSNNAMAQRLGLAAYSGQQLVTGQISGLANPEAMRAAFDSGVRVMAGHTGLPGLGNPSPNVGVVNALQPDIYIVPRRNTDINYDVSTPAQWVAEYNDWYRGWGGDRTFAQALNEVSDVMLRPMLQGDFDPWAFHQANMRAYDGKNSLTTQLLDRTLQKYSALFNLPVLAPTMAQTAERMRRRHAYNQSGVRAVIGPGRSITLQVDRAAVVPVTGLAGPGAELYGGQPISNVSLSAGQTLTLPLP